MKYIRKRENGKYEVRKWFKKEQKVITFGRFNTLKEALHYRNYFIKKGWPLELKGKYGSRPKNYSPTGKGYQITKQFNKKQIYFDFIWSEEDAKKEVGAYRKCNWDLEAVCESLDETIDGNIIMLNRFAGRVD